MGCFMVPRLMGARRFQFGLLLGLIGLGLAFGQGAGLAGPRHHRGPIYRDRSYTPAERAADLVARMSLREKAAEMITGDAPAIGRLGLKRYSWWSEAAHGVGGHQETPGEISDIWNATVYPTDLALGSSWDPGLMYREASAISDEAREIAPEQYRDLSFFAPTVNLSRDPRWGRNDETFSEDPFLTAAMASQYVNGLQGQDQSGRLLDAGGGYRKAIATLKHYAANNDEHDRMTGSSNFD
jgi:beta-glucosidase